MWQTIDPFPLTGLGVAKILGQAKDKVL